MKPLQDIIYLSPSKRYWALCTEAKLIISAYALIWRKITDYRGDQRASE